MRPLLLISYLTLRTIVGILGVSLPFVLYCGALVLFNTGLRSSISSYYHTGMGSVFVGTLFVIGFFLLSYRGYERKDDIAGDLACLFAVGVALFPTMPIGSIDPTEKIVGYIHWGFAALLFLTLIYFSLRLFTKSGGTMTPQKIQRNRVYKGSGWVMLACMFLILVHAFLPDSVRSSLAFIAPVFWLEGIAVVAFGISWLTKGEAFLKDAA